MAHKANVLGRYPSREPIDVTDKVWFYEERGAHISVVAQCEDRDGLYLGTTHAKIPMKLLVRTVDRYRKAKRKKK